MVFEKPVFSAPVEGSRSSVVQLDGSLDVLDAQRRGVETVDARRVQGADGVLKSPARLVHRA
jgi:hypothetical protein